MQAAITLNIIAQPVGVFDERGSSLRSGHLVSPTLFAASHKLNFVEYRTWARSAVLHLLFISTHEKLRAEGGGSLANMWK